MAAEDRVAGNTEKKHVRHETPGGYATSASFVPSDNSLTLAPLDEPLVIGQRGFADLLGDLAVATDDLSS
jgi:hypothetical protein